LNDLMTVAQGSINRNFVYDLLSRLTSSTNPESGTTSYVYAIPGGWVCSGDALLLAVVPMLGAI
jgi:YD repeat-containing protein